MRLTGPYEDPVGEKSLSLAGDKASPSICNPRHPLYSSVSSSIQMPAPPPNSFQAFCRSSKITPPTTATTMKKFLDASATLPIPGNPPADVLKERCAAVAWVQNAVANKLDPDTWSSMLDASLLPILMSLYNLPPATSTSGPPQRPGVPTTLEHLGSNDKQRAANKAEQQKRGDCGSCYGCLVKCNLFHLKCPAAVGGPGLPRQGRG
jgi:hypothetical protein